MQKLVLDRYCRSAISRFSLSVVTLLVVVGCSSRTAIAEDPEVLWSAMKVKFGKVPSGLVISFNTVEDGWAITELDFSAATEPIDLGRIADLPELTSLRISSYENKPGPKLINPRALLEFKRLRELSIQSNDFLDIIESGVGNLTSLTSLTLIGATRNEINILPKLRQLPHLQHLEFERFSGIDNDDLNDLDPLASLRSLSIHSDKLSDDALEQLSKCLSLEKVDIFLAEHITAEGVRKLSTLNALRELALPYVDTEVVGVLAGCEKLESLKCSVIEELTDFSRLSKLKSLDIVFGKVDGDKYSPRPNRVVLPFELSSLSLGDLVVPVLSRGDVTRIERFRAYDPADSDFSWLRQFPELREISLYGATNQTIRNFVTLYDQGALRSVNTINLEYSWSPISDEVFLLLNRFKNLKSLRSEVRYELSSRSLEVLTELTELEHFATNVDATTTESLEHIANLQGLKSLEIAKLTVSSENRILAVEMIQKFKYLENLCIDSHLNSEVHRSLKRLPALKRLTISHRNSSDFCPVFINETKSLNSITIRMIE